MKQWSTTKKLIWIFAAKIKGGISGVITKITGTLPLTLANALSHSILSLTRYGLCTQDGTPTPSEPVDIMTNNGALKFGWYDIITTSALSGYGTYVSPSGTAGNRAYKWFKDLPNGTYTFAVGGDYEIIVQWRDPADPSVLVPSSYENLSGWMTSGEVVLDKESGGYGIAVRRTVGTSSITPSNFDGTLHVQEQGIYTDGTPEVLTVSYNEFDPSTMGTPTNVSLANADSTGVVYNPSSRSLIFPCEPNTTYTVSFKSTPTGGTIFRVATVAERVTSQNSPVAAIAYDLDIANFAPKTINTGSDAALMYLQFSAAYIEDIPDILVIQKGSAIIQPQTVNDVPMLLSVGDYKDEGEIISGLITHKVGINVFDGTENISKAGNCFQYTVSGKVTGKAGLFCTHFQYSTATSSAVADLCVMEYNSATIGFRYDACADAASFKSFLAAQYAAGTPVIVLYPLATATTEQTTAQHLSTHQGTNIVDSTANVEPVEAKVEYMAAT